jgi:KUP system potassium uptake protein
VVILTVQIADVPHVAPAARSELTDLGCGLFRLIVRYGFMDEVHIPEVLATEVRCGEAFKPMDTSFFLSRQTILATTRPGMAIWREKLFAAMVRNAESAMEFFKLPTNRVIELGSQVEI